LPYVEHVPMAHLVMKSVLHTALDSKLKSGTKLSKKYIVISVASFNRDYQNPSSLLPILVSLVS
jgi:hypothetical protein